MDAGQKQQKRDPKCAQPKKPYQDARYMRTNDAEQIVNRAGYFGIVYRGIIRAEGQQTDQGKNDEKKAKYTDDLFTHKLASGRWPLASGHWVNFFLGMNRRFGNLGADNRKLATTGARDQQPVARSQELVTLP